MAGLAARRGTLSAARNGRAISRSSSRTPKPDPQLRLISLSTDDMAVPAMSRCAHGVPSLMKRWRNCAAEIEPPHLPPVFFMSATFESIILSYFGPSGRRHSFSPVALPAAISRAGKLVVVAEQAGMLLAERDHHRAGQRREIDHRLRLEALLRVPETIGEHHAALGVGVEHLDGLSRHRRDDVARTLRAAARHVLDEPDDADGVDLRLALGELVHQPDHAGRARHVALHVLHAGGGLERDAAGVEGDALADDGDRVAALRRRRPSIA